MSPITSKSTSSTIATLSTYSRLHSITKATKQAAKDLVAGYRHATALHKAAVTGKTSVSACSSSTLLDCEAATQWDDTAPWDAGSTVTESWNAGSSWDDSSAEQNFVSGTWGDSCAISTETLATTVCDEEPQSITINGTRIESPFLASFLAAGTPLDLTAATKHHLATYLKRTVEASCFSFLAAQAPWVLGLLRLENYDTIDINVYIILLDHLRSANQIPTTAFAASAKHWPEVKVFCDEKPSSRDTIGRLRQVAVHRWDYNTHLLRDVIGFLALLQDHDRIAEVEDVLRRTHDREANAIPPPTCATENEFLATIVRILERSLYRKAEAHCPSVLAANGIDHAHAKELSHLAEHVINSLSSFPAIEIEEIIYICRSLRNVAAHHNSFSAEAVQSRSEGGNVTCRYDAYPDPYTALANDAERVAAIAGDEMAVGEIRLAAWAADTSICSRERKLSVGANNGREADFYVDLARKADLERGRMDRGDARGWEAVRTLYMRYSEAAEYFAKRAIEARDCSIGKWVEDIVGDL